MSGLALKQYTEVLDELTEFPASGFVSNVSGFLIEGTCPYARLGGICEVTSPDGKHSYEAEVVGFREDRVLLMPLGEARGLGLGSRIRVKRARASIRIGPAMIGRVMDGLGRPLDGQPVPDCEEEFLLYSSPLNPMKRERISQPLELGVRAIDGLLTVGKGQRLSILSGSGVGKSVLLGMMARSTRADVNVIILVGERGREVREFIERDLGPEGMSRSVVVCATSDMPPLIRMRAAFLGTTIAEYFRNQGSDVLLMMDSATRFAMAQREVGLAAGEPPTTKGYPPSVFTMLPKLFERVGNLSSGGSITGLYTVLVDGDDINDPIGDAVRSIADGHIVLSRKLAAKNHWPAIDVNYSTSRVMPEVVSKEHLDAAARLRSILANYAEAEDLINIGAYVKGSNPQIDEAVEHIHGVRRFLKQSREEHPSFQESLEQMKALFSSSQKKANKKPEKKSGKKR